jgi:hypothetical protein
VGAHAEEEGWEGEGEQGHGGEGRREGGGKGAEVDALPETPDLDSADSALKGPAAPEVRGGGGHARRPVLPRMGACSRRASGK